MSRYVLQPGAPEIGDIDIERAIVYGWDPGLQSFFVQVDPGNAGDIKLWEGGEYRGLFSIEEIEHVLSKYLGRRYQLAEDLKRVLRKDFNEWVEAQDPDARRELVALSEERVRLLSW